MKVINATTLISLAIGGLSITTDQITFILGAVALFTAIVVNVTNYRTRKAEKKKHESEKKLADQRLQQEHEKE